MRKDECTECGWTGTDRQKESVPSKDFAHLGVAVFDLVCPKCGNEDFYPRGA